MIYELLVLTCIVGYDVHGINVADVFCADAICIPVASVGCVVKCVVKQGSADTREQSFDL